MLFIDQLRTNDSPIRVVAWGVLAGLLILLSGLWFVQVVSSKRYQADVQDQLFRTVRIPALRGKITDRHGIALAENRPSYNVNLYLEELRRQFRFEYTNQVKPEFQKAHPGEKLSRRITAQLEREARYRVVSNYLFNVSASLQQPAVLSEKEFHEHYADKRSLPYPLLKDLNFTNVAQFCEKAAFIPSLSLETQALRVYPYEQTASHILGHLKRDNTPAEEEDYSYQYRLPDYRGAAGLEAAFDQELRGRAGVKLVQVNSLQYRQAEMNWVEPIPGRNVVLTIDLPLQRAAERALIGQKSDTRGAAIVLDTRSGDILALVSAPAFNPNRFISGFTQEEWVAARMNDEELKPQFNRATHGRYPPGSIFKIIVGLAGLESGIIHPEERYFSKGYFQLRPRGRPWNDTAGPGEFDFRKAFYLSSNPYFQHFGLKTGPSKIIEMGRRFRLGEPVGLVKNLESAGYFPSSKELVKADGSRWMDGDTANLCIGQGEVIVTPLQMAVMTAAVANGGKILEPRLVMRIESQEAGSENLVTEFPAGKILAQLDLNPEHLSLVRQAMLDDVEHRDPVTGRLDATGRNAYLKDMQISGKTGTAQITQNGRLKEYITWFVSFAPYLHPRYAVVVVVEGGQAGGTSCAPVAREIYQTILNREKDWHRAEAAPQVQMKPTTLQEPRQPRTNPVRRWARGEPS